MLRALSAHRQSGFNGDDSTMDQTRPSRLKPLLQVVFAALLALSGLAHAQAIEPMPFVDHAQQLRFQHLTHELRCPMCQNETLADSNAPIARDLRNQIFRMMKQGKSDDEIKHFLVARYSNYILYDPPLNGGTLLLWFGPLLILLAGAGVVVVALRRRQRMGRGAEDSFSDNVPTDHGDDW